MIDNLVSIVMPVFNSENTIKESIDSILSQSYTDWELIIVDDVSTDNTEMLIKEYLKIDERINYIRLDVNSGAAVARNTALKKARGRFIAFLDSDDIWLPEKLDKQLKFMKSNKYGFTFTAYTMISDNGSDLNKIVSVPSSVNYKQYLKNTIIGCLTVMIDKQIIGDFLMPSVRAGQDTATWLLILRRGFKAHGLNEVLAKYRKRSDSISGNKWKALKRNWNTYRNIEKLNFFVATYYFGYYIFNAIKKHV